MHWNSYFKFFFLNKLVAKKLNTEVKREETIILAKKTNNIRIIMTNRIVLLVTT